MTDTEKLEAIKAELERRLKENMDKAKARGCLHTIAANEDKELLSIVNSLPEEPLQANSEIAQKQEEKHNLMKKCVHKAYNRGYEVGVKDTKQAMTKEDFTNDRLVFKAIPRLLEMVGTSDRAKNYTAKLADTLESEGYHTDAKLARESIKIMNGEKAAMATMDREQLSEDLEKEIDSYFAKWLQGASDEGCFNPDSQLVSIYDCHRIARHFANWQKEQMMSKAICGRVRVNAKSNYHALMYGCWDINDALKNCNDGDKVKVIVIKEE